MLSNIKDWRWFEIEKLFSIETCKCSSAIDLENGNDVYYVGAKKTENGIMKKVLRDDDLISKGNCIVFICGGQGSVGYANYMDKDFIGSSSLRVGYNENLNKYNGIFIATVLDLERPKYSFGRSWTGERLKKTKIKLPAKQINKDNIVEKELREKINNDEISNKNNPNNYNSLLVYEPDWDYMADYIKLINSNIINEIDY